MSSPNEFAIEARNLQVAYGKHTVLDGIDLSIPRGSIFALLGVNGAGKTTAIRVLTTLLRPASGSVRVCGHDVLQDAASVRRIISLAGQHAAVDELLTGSENLRMIGRLYRVAKPTARADALLRKFGLENAANRQVSTYSGGMRRRLDLAMTLVASPQVIFLDEPTTALDPQSRHMIWETVRELAREGTTILLTTQYIEEAERLADQVAILHQGRIVAQGTPAQLKRMMPSGKLIVEVVNQDALLRACDILRGAEVDGDAQILSIPMAGGVQDAASSFAMLSEARIEVSAFSWRPPSLEEVFVSVVSENDRIGVVN